MDARPLAAIVFVEDERGTKIMCMSANTPPVHLLQGARALEKMELWSLCIHAVYCTAPSSQKFSKKCKDSVLKD